MTSETHRPAGGAPAREESVTELHGEWLRLQNRLTGAPVGHEPPLTMAGRMELAAAARALEGRIAETRSCSTAEVILKLKLAACSILLTGNWRALVDSAAQDLRSGFPARE